MFFFALGRRREKWRIKNQKKKIAKGNDEKRSKIGQSELKHIIRKEKHNLGYRKPKFKANLLKFKGADVVMNPVFESCVCFLLLFTRIWNPVYLTCPHVLFVVNLLSHLKAVAKRIPQAYFKTLHLGENKLPWKWHGWIWQHPSFPPMFL